MDFIEENNKREITNCFILYVDKDCGENEKETVCNFKCQHCLTKETKILKENYEWTPINKIKKGDKVFGFTKGNLFLPTNVKQNSIRKDKVYEIITDKGKIKATSNHRFLNSYGKWISIDKILFDKNNNLKIGSSRCNIKYLSYPEKFIENENYMLGYINGIMKGDGSIGESIQKEKWVCRWASLRLNDIEAIERYSKYLKHFNIDNNISFCKYTHFSNGKKIKMNRVEFRDEKRINQLKKLIKMKNNKDFLYGYLAGFFDAEGSYSGGTIRISQKDEILLKDLIKKFKKIGFNFVFEKGNRADLIRLIGKFDTKLRFFTKCKPAITRKYSKLKGINKLQKAKIIDIKYKGIKEVYNFETDLGTYWANGLASHNCYYRFSNQRMKTLNEMKAEVDRMVSLGANHVQITGAEPTIHKDIIELITYIKSKKVLCSVITNGYLISIPSVAEKYKELVDYFLMSIHGINKTWNDISQVKDAYEHTLKALKNCNEFGIDVHFNTTLVKQNYKQLNEIVLLAKEYGVKRCNFINFNPFCSFKTAAGQNVVDQLIVSYDEVVPMLEEAHDLCIANNIDFAIRYFPMCKLPEYMRKYNFNYSTLQFDWNEWNYRYWFPDDYAQGINKMKSFVVEKGLEGTEEQKLLHAFGRFYPGFRGNFTELDECKKCNDYLICDGIHTEQLQQFPSQVFKGTKPPFKKNAKYYIEKGDDINV